ncbi:8304_t:CDS:2, partial [Funneliformis geosporum]
YKLEKFNQAMVYPNKFIGNGPFIDYDWGLNENSTVVDVGGGNGGTIVKLLSQYKKTKGIILDLDVVIEHTRKVLKENIHKELSDRVEFFPGSLFVDPPPKADVYYLKLILHDWSDTSAIKILKNLRSAISPSGPPTKLVLLEMIMDEPIRDNYLTQMDLSMLCTFLGKERTTQEFINILKKSGWKYVKSVNTRGYISVIEAG